MVLPAGTSLPPLPHLLVLLAGVGAVGWLLRRERPAVTGSVVLALAPWMVVGAALHVLYQVGTLPGPVAPFFGTPAVYVTTAVVAGAVWLAAGALGGDEASGRVGGDEASGRIAGGRAARVLGGAGLVLALAAVALTLAVGGVVRVAVPLGALLAGVALGVGVWLVLGRLRPDDVETVGSVGLLVLCAHALDGVSTAAGVDVLGFGERSPASRAIMDVAAALPTAELLGVGWLFVLVKLAIAAAVVVLFADYVREEPAQGNALLGLIAAVGLGPGTHNLLLYAVASA